MKQQELFKKIGNIVQEINEQYGYLQQAGELFNDLELELMAANANFLSGHIEILRKIKKSSEQEAPPKPSPPVGGRASEFFEVSPTGEDPITIGLEGVTQLPKTQEWFIPETSEDAPKEEDKAPEPETIRYELTLDDIGEDWDEDETYIKPEPVAEKMLSPEILQPVAQPHTKIIVEEKQVLTFNERIAASRTTEPANPQPISDLKSAITLNDKLLYVKDLFNGYSLAYSEALDILNRFHSFEEAESFLKVSYALKNNWADKEATAGKFYALLRRRFV